MTSLSPRLATHDRNPRHRRPLVLLVLLAGTGFLAIFDNVVTISSLPFARNPAALVAVTLLGLYVWFRRKGIPAYNGTFRWVLGFLLYTAVLELLRGVWTGDPEPLRYAQWMQILILTILSIDLARDRRALPLVWGGIVAATVFMAASTVVALPAFTEIHEGRIGFTGVNLNRQGYWYAMGATSLLWSILNRWPRFGWQGIGLVVAMATLTFAMVQTGSRGAILSMAVGSAIVLVTSLRARNVSAYATFVPLLLLLGGLYVADATILRERIAATLAGEDFGSRDVIVLRAIDLLAERPWFGYGPGFVEELGAARGMDRAISSHNSFLQVGLTFGLSGLVLWLAIMASAWTRTWRSWHAYRQPVGALLLALVTMSLAFGLVADLAFNKYFWTLIALAAQAPLREATGLADAPRPARRGPSAFLAELGSRGPSRNASSPRRSASGHT